jgi:hypothetical protein
MQRHVDAVWRNCEQHLQWIASLSAEQRASRGNEIQRLCAVLYHLAQTVQVVDEVQAQHMAQQIMAYRTTFEL